MTKSLFYAVMSPAVEYQLCALCINCHWLSMTSPEHLLETVITARHVEAFVLAHVHSHSCDSLQCNSVKSGSSQRGWNATSHPYPKPSAAALAALSDWCVSHGNNFQNPSRAAKNWRYTGVGVVFLKEKKQNIVCILED